MAYRSEPQSLLQQHAGRGGFNLDNAWRDLQIGVTEILQHKPMNKKRYLGLYNLVYQYCTSGSATASSESYRQRELKSTEFLGEKLYGDLRGFLKNYLLAKSKEGSDKLDSNVLAFYHDNWEIFTHSCPVIHNIFTYLNRHWVRRELEDGKKNVYEIYSLLLVSWRDHFLGMIMNAVTAAFLKLIENERNGQGVEHKYIQCIVRSYVELGVENTSSSRGRILTFYKDKFEKHFLEKTKDYYDQESSEFLSKNTVTVYVKKADSRLSEESSRADKLLHESTKAPLIALCEQVLIFKYQEQFYEELRLLLDRESTDDIGHLYRLASRVKETLVPMKDILQEHIKKQGLRSIESIKDKAMAEPQLYARELLNVMNIYKAMVMRAFGNDGLYVQALDEGCKEFINKNVVTQNGKNKNKTPELIARYSDILLKKSSKLVEEAELEDVLQQIVVLLKYVEDGDVFKNFYESRFAKRMISHSSISEDAERLMITKLKDAFGNTYTAKLERMYKDVELSKGLNEQFRQHTEMMGTRGDVDFNIQVLTQGHWTVSDIDKMALPSELDICVQRFIGFYMAQHNGRKLAWCYSQSSGDLTGNFQKRKYTFTVSTYQMAVLLQFNLFENRTFEELKDNTQISPDNLQLVLRTLLKTKLLTCDSLSADEAVDIQEAAVMRINQKYNHKKLRININTPLRNEVKQEEEITNRRIEDERKFETDAAIVRVMKMRKALKHNELISEVISILRPRFIPTISLIKKRIEELIAKEYLKRAEGVKDFYHYVA